MSQIWDNPTVKAAIFHPSTRAAIRSFPKGLRKELGKVIFDLQMGAVLTMPLSRPMSSVAPGAEELRFGTERESTVSSTTRDRRKVSWCFTLS
jgi:hypothetical protein